MGHPSTLSRKRRPSSRPASAIGRDIADSGQVPADITATAWTPRGELDHGQWAATGRRLGAIGRASQWWIADWLRYGTAKWGEKYVEAARLTGYDTASLRNMVWVASQFDDSSLRNDKLTWSHHVLVASLEDEQKREWLQHAAAERMTVADLRSELRAAKAGGDAAPPNGGSSPPPTAAGPVVCPKCGHQLGPSDQA